MRQILKHPCVCGGINRAGANVWSKKGTVTKVSQLLLILKYEDEFTSVFQTQTSALYKIQTAVLISEWIQ